MSGCAAGLRATGAHFEMAHVMHLLLIHKLIWKQHLQPVELQSHVAGVNGAKLEMATPTLCSSVTVLGDKHPRSTLDGLPTQLAGVQLMNRQALEDDTIARLGRRRAGGGLAAGRLRSLRPASSDSEESLPRSMMYALLATSGPPRIGARGADSRGVATSVPPAHSSAGAS